MNNLPTIDIKGKQYVQVKDRIVYFNENFIRPCISTELLSKPEDTLIVVKATVSYEHVSSGNAFRCFFTGHSQATVGDGYINKTAALENAETSAVGRALAMMGIGVIDSVASADEVVKATSPRNEVQELAEKIGGTVVQGKMCTDCGNPTGSSFPKCKTCYYKK